MVKSSWVILLSLILICLVSAVTPRPLRAQTSQETALWNAVKDSKDAEDYKGYLDKYPDGTYAPLAKRRIAQYSAHPSEPASAEPTAKTRANTSSIQLQTEHVPTPKSGASTPITMTECEGTNNCATWTFLGKQGTGQWPSGETASLTVEHFDSDSVVIHRADATGPSAGLTAEYRGTRKGERIAGEFTVTRSGDTNPVTANWYATIGQSQKALPRLLHACVRCSPGYGATWVWENDHYTNVAAPEGIHETLTVESFTRESVILHMTRTGRYPGTDVMRGQISPQGNSIVNGVLKDGRTFHMAWGDALDTVSGTRALDPVVIARPLVCYGWFFVVCE